MFFLFAFGGIGGSGGLSVDKRRGGTDATLVFNPPPFVDVVKFGFGFSEESLRGGTEGKGGFSVDKRRGSNDATLVFNPLAVLFVDVVKFGFGFSEESLRGGTEGKGGFAVLTGSGGY